MVEGYLFTIFGVVFMLIAGAMACWWAERLVDGSKHRAGRFSMRTIHCYLTTRHRRRLTLDGLYSGTCWYVNFRCLDCGRVPLIKPSFGP
jgi:hypothetical protein